jgi:hypothetical protein
MVTEEKLNEISARLNILLLPQIPCKGDQGLKNCQHKLPQNHCHKTKTI